MPNQHRTSTCKPRNRLTTRLVACAATGATALLVAPLASAATPTVIGIDGIKQLVPGGNIMGALDTGGGYYRNQPGTNVVQAYSPQGFGVLTDIAADHLVGGFNDPGYDQSVAIAQGNTFAAVKQARADNPNGQITVVGFSQGSDAATHLLAQMEAEGYDTSNINFVLVENPDNADGGIKTRFSFLPGVYVPLLGVTVGGQQATTSDHTHVLQIVKQYDGFADFPVYAFNVVAVANAMAGIVLLHSNVDSIDLVNDPYVETTTPNGMITNRMYITPTVPLLMLAEQFGLPKPVAEALDPFVRAVIETGYNRPDPSHPGTYPTQAVPLQLAPPPAAWAGDVQSVIQGATQTGQKLGALANPGPSLAPLPQTASLSSGASQPQQLSVPVQQDVVQQPAAPVDEQQPLQQRPRTNVVRNSFDASVDGSSINGQGTGTHNTDPVGQLVNTTVKSFTDGVNNVVKSVTGSLSGAPKPTGNSSTNSSSTSSSSSSSSGTP